MENNRHLDSKIRPRSTDSGKRKNRRGFLHLKVERGNVLFARGFVKNPAGGNGKVPILSLSR
jgi:hypothetical protein